MYDTEIKRLNLNPKKYNEILNKYKTYNKIFIKNYEYEHDKYKSDKNIVIIKYRRHKKRTRYY